MSICYYRVGMCDHKVGNRECLEVLVGETVYSSNRPHTSQTVSPDISRQASVNSMVLNSIVMQLCYKAWKSNMVMPTSFQGRVRRRSGRGPKTMSSEKRRGV